MGVQLREAAGLTCYHAGVRKKKDPGARLHDAVMSAAARDHGAHISGRRRDNVRAVLAIGRVAWRLRRAEKKKRRKHR